MHSSLELDMFFRRISYFFIIGDKTITFLTGALLFNVYVNYCVRAVTACNALWARDGLQGFRSEIG